MVFSAMSACAARHARARSQHPRSHADYYAWPRCLSGQRAWKRASASKHTLSKSAGSTCAENLALIDGGGEDFQNFGEALGKEGHVAALGAHRHHALQPLHLSLCHPSPAAFTFRPHVLQHTSRQQSQQAGGAGGTGQRASSSGRGDASLHLAALRDSCAPARAAWALARAGRGEAGRDRAEDTPRGGCRRLHGAQ